MGLVVERIIELSKKLTNIQSICELGEIDADCPWKKYEGFSNKEFIKENFSSFKKHLDDKELFFEENLANACKEIVFVKVNIEALGEICWLTVYLCDHHHLDNFFIIAGEPFEKLLVPKILPNRTLWKEYPKYLQDFWKVHSFWFCGDDNSFDLESIIKNGLPTYTGDGDIIHPCILHDSGYNSFVEKDYISLCIQDESDIYDEEDKERIYVPKEYTEIGFEKYVEEYLKQAIYSHEINGDGVYFVPSLSGQVNIFWHGYNDQSYFYKNFSDYLIGSSSLSQIELAIKL